MEFNTLASVAWLATSSITAQISGPTCELSARRMTSAEVEIVVSQIIGQVTARLAAECAKTNAELRADGLPACHSDHCIAWYVQQQTPDRISLELTFGHSRFETWLTLQFLWTWSGASSRSASLCYHPRLAPLTQQFERTVRERLRSVPVGEWCSKKKQEAATLSEIF